MRERLDAMTRDKAALLGKLTGLTSRLQEIMAENTALHQQLAAEGSSSVGKGPDAVANFTTGSASHERATGPGAAAAVSAVSAAIKGVYASSLVDFQMPYASCLGLV
eukprot:gene5064-5305_t